ncbi:hypothetical protein Tco_0981106, partial [Tanacetum coccineum]
TYQTNHWTIHVDFDELTTMASEHSSSGPTLHEMTLATISSGFVPNPPPSTPLVPPSRSNWDTLFQLLFDELLTPPPSVDNPAPEFIAPITEVVDVTILNFRSFYDSYYSSLFILVRYAFTFKLNRID